MDEFKVSVVCLFMLLTTEVLAQGTAADYERSRNLSSLTRGKVVRDRVEPHWFDDDQRFWYRIDTGDGAHQFVVVDPTEGTRREAFDHKRLAYALGGEIGANVDPKRLPFRSIRFEKPSKLWFVVDRQGWEWDLESFELASAPKVETTDQSTVLVLDQIRPSRSAGPETSIEFINRTNQVIDLFWISGPGQQPYGKVEPREQRTQHTFAGHVWVAKNSEDQVLGAFEATPDPGTAVIDGSWQPRVDPETRPAASDPMQSPDGRWRVEVSHRRVKLVDTASGETFPLANDGTEADRYLREVYWSPDSKKVVVIREQQGDRRRVPLVESSPSEQLQPQLHWHDYAKPGDSIARPRPCLFDVREQKPIAIDDSLFKNPWRLSRYRWDDDSDRFTFLYNERGHRRLDLLAIDAQSGECIKVIDEQSETFLCYSSKQYLHHVPETNEIVWMSERDGWCHLYLYDARLGKVKNQITSGEWVVRGVERVDDVRRQIWFRAGGIDPEQDPYHEHYCRVNFDGTGLVRLTTGDGNHRLQYSPDGDYYLDTYSRVDMPPVTELRRSEDGSLVCLLERADWSRLVATGWKAPERFVAKGRDGTTDIYGVIYKPSTFDPERRYPIIEAIYAGPHSAHVPKSFATHYAAQATAEIGFVVVQIDGMGTSHRSKAFHDVCWKNLKDAGFPDRVKWIEAAAAERPWMDTSRVGIYGGSAGGQNAMRALIDHGDLYRVAVADCGCHDNRMDKIWWNEQWMGWPVGPEYEASSNVADAHRMQGKLLLTVGELDRNVDPASTMQVVDALIAADKDFDLVVFPGSGHGAGSSEYGKRRMYDFFVRHLYGRKPRE